MFSIGTQQMSLFCGQTTGLMGFGGRKEFDIEIRIFHRYIISKVAVVVILASIIGPRQNILYRQHIASTVLQQRRTISRNSGWCYWQKTWINGFCVCLQFDSDDGSSGVSWLLSSVPWGSAMSFYTQFLHNFWTGKIIRLCDKSSLCSTNVISCRFVLTRT